ncbi:aspartyl-tRNA(Asn)/glutamyl-tRNA(Gln) amidotransferase subunit A [Hasllibacter halocynthiae]|uniref:Aspartyl-tRNA(Asn)/glutamyl-tRNA(Gln) amidotransferase subunit A n=1 Tax=Hasllibacter halocynthiae TaxID=595589 RepID=A0A2T0X1E4_9RHOB|nr:amidase family protein [Hasllibacter halocynthiae]PRY92769.1 aspartyl-tRNA(Asn)/glutamyl-tRNA(Gln) amidotransferase subunit A [Hasllibacter halocynthiae]
MEPWSRSAADLGRAIGAGTVDPVALCEAMLERIEGHEHGARVYARLMPARARAEARAAAARARGGARRGPLDGVPVSWKDLFDTAGTGTEAGSRLLAGRVPEADAEVVARGARAGWVALGKTHLSELAFSGLGLNPSTATPPGAHDAGLLPGGSSSGAAASVAWGLAPVAVGSDTGGSIRLPAAWNDLVGFKPGWGRVPGEGAVPLCETLDCAGPLARTVEDCALVHAVLAGEKPTALEGASLEGARIMVLEGMPFEGIEEAPAAAFEAALERLAAAGAEVVRRAPPQPAEADAMSGTIYAGEAWAIWGDLIERNPGVMFEQIEARMRGGEGLSAREHIGAWRRLRALRAGWREETAGFDAVATPTSPILPPRAEGLEGEAYRRANLLALRNTRIGNLLDCCGVSLPAGAASCGLQMLAPGGAEGRLLRLAAAAKAALG